MADKLKIAPRVSIVSKGVILDEGETVTVENFASDKVFESLKKTKKIVTEAEFIEIQKKLANPKAEAKKNSGKQASTTEAGKSDGKAGA